MNRGGANSSRFLRSLQALPVILLIVGLRLIALRSDPFPRLDWSAGLLTDEGFYIHNARNVVLFGHAVTDEFNNMLLSPLLHFVQVAVFKLTGVGSVQARLISVVCSLLTLVLLWAALRRAFDKRIAFTALLLLGLDHTNLLYNRMALMDTPASLLAVIAFYCFVRGVQATENSTSKNQVLLWLSVCGAFIALTITARTLCIYLLPVPFIALAVQALRRSDIRELPRTLVRFSVLSVGLGLVIVFALYAVVWYWPHHAEITAMNNFYRTYQIQPRSFGQAAWNVYRTFLGPSGLASYLFRHTPVVFTLALLGLVLRPKALVNSVEAYLIAWLLLGWSLLAVSSYSPSRYYVTTYPALSALAAITLWRLPEVWKRLQEKDCSGRVIRASCVGFLTYHAVQIGLDHYGARTAKWAGLFLYGLPAAFSILALRFSLPDVLAKLLEIKRTALRFQVAGVLALWFLFNTFWLGGWLIGLDHTQYRMSRWLALNLPPGSVLIGDVAPGVGLDNNFITVPVQPGLCNYVLPVETMGARYVNASRYVIMDDRWKERYWVVRYPELVTTERRIKLESVLRWQVGVYAVDFEQQNH